MLRLNCHPPEITILRLLEGAEAGEGSSRTALDPPLKAFSPPWPLLPPLPPSFPSSWRPSPRSRTPSGEPSLTATRGLNLSLLGIPLAITLCFVPSACSPSVARNVVDRDLQRKPCICFASQSTRPTTPSCLTHT